MDTTTTVTINMVAVPKETRHHGNNNNKPHNSMVVINRYQVALNNNGINGEVIITIREVDREAMAEVMDIKNREIEIQKNTNNIPSTL